MASEADNIQSTQVYRAITLLFSQESVEQPEGCV